MEKSWGLEPEQKEMGFGVLQGPRACCLGFLQVTNLSQRELAISVHFWVPVLLHGAAVWDVAAVAPSQVPAGLPSLGRAVPTAPCALSPGTFSSSAAVSLSLGSLLCVRDGASPAA